MHADAAAPTHEHLEQLPYLRAVVKEVRSRCHDRRKTRLQTSSCMPDCIAAQLEPISHCPAFASIRHNLILERCRATRFAGACAGAAAVPGNSHLPARSSGGRRAAVRRLRVGRCCMTDPTPARCSSLLQQPCLPSVPTSSMLTFQCCVPSMHKVTPCRRRGVHVIVCPWALASIVGGRI